MHAIQRWSGSEDGPPAKEGLGPKAFMRNMEKNTAIFRVVTQVRRSVRVETVCVYVCIGVSMYVHRFVGMKVTCSLSLAFLVLTSGLFDESGS